MKFTHGFQYKGILFGLHQGQLYRLPQIIGQREYPLRLLKPIPVGKKIGYLLCQDRKSMDQVRHLIKPFKTPITINYFQFEALNK